MYTYKLQPLDYFDEMKPLIDERYGLFALHLDFAK